MINYFLREDPKATPKIKKIIKQKITSKRKYQPFHIQCSKTHKKICYCVNNPVMNIKMNPDKKQKIWEKYEQAERFYLGEDKKDLQTAEKQFEMTKQKIQCLSKKQVIHFVKSIKKERNLMGQIVQY